jgi:hypothetical protein
MVRQTAAPSGGGFRLRISCAIACGNIFRDLGKQSPAPATQVQETPDRIRPG